MIEDDLNNDDKEMKYMNTQRDILLKKEMVQKPQLIKIYEG